MLSATAIRGWYAVHKWTSLVATLLLLMLCVTGLPLIFYHEIDHALGHSTDPPALASPTARAHLDDVVAAAAARRPGDAVQFVYRESDEPDAWFVRLGKTVDAADASGYYTFDARTGNFLNDYPLDQGVMNVLFRLHYDMFAGLSGTLFLGVMGLLLVASLVSGVVVYGPFMAKLKFGTVRNGRSPRLRWLDLHNLLGIATAVWLLVVGATGVVNTLAIPIFAYWQGTALPALTAQYRDAPAVEGTLSPERALAAASAATPGMELDFMAFPGNAYATPHHFIAFMHGATPFTAKLLTPVLVDAQTNEVTAQTGLPWYVATLLLSQPLHFGDYGGLPLKILWALLDVIAIVVLGSGVYLWLRKRSQPFAERLRVAQPLEEPALALERVEAQ